MTQYETKQTERKEKQNGWLEKPTDGAWEGREGMAESRIGMGGWMGGEEGRDRAGGAGGVERG